MKRKRSTAIGLLLVLSGLSYGVIGFTEDGPSYTITKTAGQPVVLNFKDGRQAEFFYTKRPALDLSIPLSLEENTCLSSWTKPICTLLTPFRNDEIQLRWTKNPDSTKLNQVVSENQPSQFDVKNDIIHFSFEKFFNDPDLADMQYDRIVCDDYSWLPGGTTAAPPQSLRIARWDSEAMSNNPETGLLENRSTGGAYDVQLVSRGAQGAQIQSIGVPTTPDVFSGVPASFNGDLISWIVQGSSGEFCQMTFTPNVGPATAQVNNMKTDTTFLPVNYDETARSYREATNLITTLGIDQTGVMLQ